MCGIVGYIGNQKAKEILLKGLERLEYRGYDSAGIALLKDSEIEVYKEKGRIATLRQLVPEDTDASVGIGHTRWATHGKPSRVNAHPHQSSAGRFTLVHNGVIENYMELKKTYLNSNVLISDTDTEIIVQMIEKLVQDGMEVEEAFRTTLQNLEGSYAFALVDNQDTTTIYVAKHKSPLLIGVGEGFNVIASDAMAVIDQTKQFIELMDQEIVILQKDVVTIKDLKGNLIQRRPFTAQIDANDIEKGTYPHYMLKEIEEQPSVIRNIIQHYQNEKNELNIDSTIKKAMINADRLYIVACGTSYHAGLVGKNMIEQIANIPVEVHIASEFVYNQPLLTDNPLFIFISQSGETADSRASLKHIKSLGYQALTITNVPGSTLSRESDYTLLLHAGPEIAVASTKAYTAQIAVLAILAVNTALTKGIELDFNPLQELAVVAQAMDILCNQKQTFEELNKSFLATTRNAFFIGRAVDYYVSLEGALKLKEISYIQAEGFAGGELKHGTIALIEEGTPVIGLITHKQTALNLRGNVKEVAARGANPLIISMEGMEEEEDSLVLPRVHEQLTPLISVVPLQLIAYYAALSRGCDVDKPRNLAKSVTVE
ncbi:glutamine--fructose-6-phosphate transaminase (isomerizing) [Priestia megaterium]|nr:glutamine--fructose-6-phosphate transaminase (isomerizing) [Priestia megaterium]